MLLSTNGPQAASPGVTAAMRRVAATGRRHQGAMAFFDRPGLHGPIKNADPERLVIHAFTLALATLEWKGKCVRFGVRFASGR